MMKNFLFNLSQTLEYSVDGKKQTTATLEFRAPAITEYDELVILNQYVMQAMLSVRKHINEDDVDQKDEKIGKVKGQELKMMLLGSDIPFLEIVEAFKKIATRTGTADGKTPLKRSHFDRLLPGDLTNLVCDYCANFIFPSLL